jgi:cysteine desulfurase family protein (TIGR01976 family)
VQPFDVSAARAHFPSLARMHDGRPVAYLDGPAGTQVPSECIAATVAYWEARNANTGGAFLTSRESDALIDEAHAAAADFIGASDPSEVSFGPNMTTLTFAVSRAIGRVLRRGDELVVTRLDHDANIAPWLAIAEERGLEVRWVDFHRDDCTLDLESLESAMSPRTRLVAVTMASNAVGTLTPIRRIADLVHRVGAWLWIDAVHASPHIPIDVVELDADFLVFSPYKSFGPHLGVLWSRRQLLESLPALKVRPAPDALPSRWETGTQPHELLAGLLGTFRYLEWVGASQGGASGAAGARDGARRRRLRAAMEASRRYERSLMRPLIDGLCSVTGVQVRGIVDPSRFEERCPTVSFTLAGRHPGDVAAALGERGIFVWDGDYYALEVARALGVAETGGMVRVGLVHYNTRDEIERLVGALDEIAAG